MTDAKAQPNPPTGYPAEDPDSPRFGPGARALIVAAIALIAVAVYLLLSSGGDEETDSSMMTTPYAEAEKLEVSEVAGLPEQVGHPVFWAGEKNGEPIGVSTDDAGNVHLRYLPEDVDPRTPEPSWLDIGSYPFPGAYRATSDLVEDKGNVPVKVPGAVAFYPESRPTSVILAFRKAPDVQVEVFHPEPDKALAFAKSGDIVPVP